MKPWPSPRPGCAGSRVGSRVAGAAETWVPLTPRGEDPLETSRFVASEAPPSGTDDIADVIGFPRLVHVVARAVRRQRRAAYRSGVGFGEGPPQEKREIRTEEQRNDGTQ